MRVVLACIFTVVLANAAPTAFDANHVPHSRACGITGSRCHVLPTDTVTVPSAPAKVSTCTHMTCTAKLHKCSRHNLDVGLWAPARGNPFEHANAVCQLKMATTYDWHSAAGKADRKAAHAACVKSTLASGMQSHKFDGEECGGDTAHYSLTVNHDKSEAHCGLHRCFVTKTGNKKQCECHAVDENGNDVPVDCVQTESESTCRTGQTIAATGQKCGTGVKELQFGVPTQLPYAGGEQCQTNRDVPCDTGVSCDVDCIETRNVGSCQGSCGTGSQLVSFTVHRPANGNGRQCSSSFSQPCDTGVVCDVDCIETAQVGACQGSCGTGTQSVTYRVLRPARGNGRACSSPTTQSCNTGKPCCHPSHNNPCSCAMETFNGCEHCGSRPCCIEPGRHHTCSGTRNIHGFVGQCHSSGSRNCAGTCVHRYGSC